SLSSGGHQFRRVEPPRFHTRGHCGAQRGLQASVPPQPEGRGGLRENARAAARKNRCSRRLAAPDRLSCRLDTRHRAFMTLRLGMVAGEPSGDLLAARIIHGIQGHVDQSRFEGIGGPAMRAQGLDAWHDMRALTVFGYVDAFKRLPSLLNTYFDVKKRWLARKPDVFVGIDAPDF